MFDPSKLDLNIDTSKSIPLDDQEEGVIARMIQDTLDEIGAEAVVEIIIPYIERIEDYLRENEPNHPALEMLDDHRKGTTL